MVLHLSHAMEQLRLQPRVLVCEVGDFSVWGVGRLTCAANQKDPH